MKFWKGELDVLCALELNYGILEVMHMRHDKSHDWVRRTQQRNEYRAQHVKRTPNDASLVFECRARNELKLDLKTNRNIGNGVSLLYVE